jgi:4-hydroxy-tetrahydrodipicolinate reductase
MIRVLVNGARGKMGQETVKAITQYPQLFQLVGQNHSSDQLVENIKNSQAQVVVDFTNATSGYENTKTIIESGAHPVIGTSGFTQEQVHALQQLSKAKKLGGIIAPNFSIGAVLMMKFAQEAARYFPQVEIIELHHDAKQDSPSGTAIKTAEMMNAVRNAASTPASIKVEEKQIIPGARGANLNGVAIHSVRLPGLVAHQEVIFGGTAETLTIRHDTIHREAFMPGVCLACQKVIELDELVYGLEGIL